MFACDLARTVGLQGPPPTADLRATEARMARNVFATLTAAAPTTTPAPRATPTPAIRGELVTASREVRALEARRFDLADSSENWESQVSGVHGLLAETAI